MTRRLLPLFSCLLMSLFAPVGAETLQLGIEHSEYLPPISQDSGTDQSRHPVSLLSSNATRYGAQQYYQSRPQKMVEWFQIPGWMAGTWSKQGDVTVSATDLVTGYSTKMNEWIDNRMTVSFGHQVDRSGTIWQANILPAETDSMSGAKSVRFIAVARKCERFSPSELVTRTHYIITESYGATGQICEQFQQESLNDYTMLNTGELMNRSSNRVFTYAGRPTRDGNLESRFNKLAGFSPRNELDGVDLRSAFTNFLASLGRPDLAP